MNSDLQLASPGPFGLTDETTIVIRHNAVIQARTTSNHLRGIRWGRYSQREWTSCLRKSMNAMVEPMLGDYFEVHVLSKYTLVALLF